MIIEQLMELVVDKTYYLRVSENSSDSDISDLGDNIKSLCLGCNIIVGRGGYDMVEIPDRRWGTIL